MAERIELMHYGNALNQRFPITYSQWESPPLCKMRKTAPESPWTATSPRSLRLRQGERPGGGNAFSSIGYCQRGGACHAPWAQTILDLGSADPPVAAPAFRPWPGADQR